MICKRRPSLLVLAVLLTFVYASATSVLGAEKTRFYKTAKKGLRPATSADYGRTLENPIKVGGGYTSGHWNRTTFLLSLRGPDGQKVNYVRLGQGGQYKSSATPFGFAVVDLFEVSYSGLESPIEIYIDFNEFKKPRIPEGFIFELTTRDDWKAVMHSSDPLKDSSE